MNTDNLLKLTENNYNRLLIVIFILLISIALPENRVIPKLVTLILFLISMLSIMHKIRYGRRWFKFYAGLIFSNLILLVILIVQHLGILNLPAVRQGQIVIEFALFIVISLPIFLIQQEIFSTQRVTADTLKGGISIFLLLGLAWATFYTILYSLNPGAFNGIEPSQFQADLLHFSFVTLTTVGFGDIHPLVMPARIATDLEAVAGVMYPAILISRLVSLYNPHSQESV